jgi:hypothetical protein
MNEGLENALYVAVGMLLGAIGTIVLAVFLSGSRTTDAAAKLWDEGEDEKPHLKAM